MRAGIGAIRRKLRDDGHNQCCIASPSFVSATGCMGEMRRGQERPGNGTQVPSVALAVVLLEGFPEPLGQAAAQI